MSQKVFAILLAAGSGERFGANLPKCFATLQGVTLVEKSFKSLLEVKEIAGIFIAIPDGYENNPVVESLKKQGAHVFTGGKSRRESVFNGLKALQSYTQGQNVSVDECYCVIHDAARIYTQSHYHQKIIREVLEKKAVTLAVPSVDSLKEVDESNKVVKSLRRESIFSIQTPQAFWMPVILKAHNEWDTLKDNEPTDDASMVEPICPVYIVEGDMLNRKITFQADL